MTIDIINKSDYNFDILIYQLKIKINLLHNNIDVVKYRMLICCSREHRV